MTAPADEIIIVSGLPRSGTSMLMQMLGAGGVALLCDAARPPDRLNPRGYFEYAPVRRIASGCDWIDAAAGRAVKVVAPLICQLPAEHAYAILFIRRRLETVAASQQRMVEFLHGHAGVAADWPALLARDEADSLKWSNSQRSARLLVVNYEDCIDNPGRISLEIARFVRRDLDVGKMSTVVDNSIARAPLK